MYYVMFLTKRILNLESIRNLNKTTCVFDPFPNKLLTSHLSSILNIIVCVVNLCISSGIFPTSCKSSITFPLIKKQGLLREILKVHACNKPSIHFGKNYCNPNT